MISSLFSKFKDIVSLTPVNCLTSDQLAPMLYDVIGIVQNAGFSVVVVVSDNNQVNAKAFQTICGSNSFEEGIDNPHYAGHKIFFLFDTVHILKCMRNNWLNQTDSKQTFVYPPLTLDISIRRQHCSIVVVTMRLTSQTYHKAQLPLHQAQVCGRLGFNERRCLMNNDIHPVREVECLTYTPHQWHVLKTYMKVRETLLLRELIDCHIKHCIPLTSNDSKYL
jgi:hypothetical protein